MSINILNASRRLQRLAVGCAAALLFAQSALAFYNPSTGRWLSRDPLGKSGGLNAYAFVANQPLSWIDSKGLYSEPAAPPDRRNATCIACRCKQVTVEYHPGGGSLELGWYLDPDGGIPRYGNEVHVHWEVDGDPGLCHYYQDEAGTSLTYTRPDGSRNSVRGKNGNDADQDYTDYMGFNPIQGGEYLVDVLWNVTFRCVSSDTSIPPVTRHDGPWLLLSRIRHPPN
jgi:hypothetical protein